MLSIRVDFLELLFHERALAEFIPGLVNNGFLTFYNPETGDLIHQDGQNGHIHEVSISSNFEQLVVAAHERLTKWTMQTTQEKPDVHEEPTKGSKASNKADSK